MYLKGGIILMEHINLLVVFVEGLLSLFSPCILPILPVYLSILSNSSVQELKEGEVKFKNSPLLKNTVLFVLGISTTFFILGSSITVLKQFFTSNKQTISLIGGILIILMGLFYLGYLNLPFLQREKKLNIEVREMKPLTAYLLGFAFSFGWTPCVGPMLASVLIMASSSKTVFMGNLLILVYTLGITLPFVIAAMFYDRLFRYIDKIKLHMETIKKIGGAILLITGLVMALGGTDKITGYFKKTPKTPVEYNQKVTDNNKDKPKEIAEKEKNSSDKEEKVPAPDFTLVDQYGKTHTLSDYKGKVVFLNFWATWCPPCRMEMPHIEEIYKDNKNNSGDVIILGVAGPNIGREGSEKDITNFLNKEGYSFPVVFDKTGDHMIEYGIQSLPSTFIIDKEGNVVKYVPGAMQKKTMETLINEAK